MRDVQLETLKDLEEKDGKISDLQQRYSEILAEQLQQRAKLEIDLEDNRYSLCDNVGCIAISPS